MTTNGMRDAELRNDTDMADIQMSADLKNMQFYESKPILEGFILNTCKLIV